MCAGSLLYQLFRLYKFNIKRFVRNVYGVSVEESIMSRSNKRYAARRDSDSNTVFGAPLASSPTRLASSPVTSIHGTDALGNVYVQEAKPAPEVRIATPAPPPLVRAPSEPPPTATKPSWLPAWLERAAAARRKPPPPPPSIDVDTFTRPSSGTRTVSTRDPLLFPELWGRTSEPPQYYDRTPYLVSRAADLDSGRASMAARAPPKPRKAKKFTRRASLKRKNTSGSDAASKADSVGGSAESKDIGKDVRQLAKTISSVVKSELSMALASNAGPLPRRGKD